MATNLGIPVVEEGKYYFISYNTEDAQLVSRYLKELYNNGLPMWYDYGIPRGTKWQEIIAEKIHGCEAVIMFISSNIFKKEESFVHKEWDIAKRRKKKIFLVMLEEIEESKIPARYDFWWSDICSTQTLFAHKLDFDSCVDKILGDVGYIRKIDDNQNVPVNIDDFEIEAGVLKKYKGTDSVVRIPNGVTSIGDEAFLGCTLITSIIIPDGVISIGEYAFRDCTSLTKILIPDSVTSIGYSAFFNCTLLNNIDIPNNVISIDGLVFGCCTSLTNIKIPDGVTNIGGFSFTSCTSLTEIIIPDSVTSIGNFAFSYCRNLKVIRYGGSEAEWSLVKKGDHFITSDCLIYYNQKQ